MKKVADGSSVPSAGDGARRSRVGPFLAVTVGHLTIDIFNSMGPVLVAFLRQPLALTGAQVGLAVGAYQFLAGVTQPPFGWLADRIGSRWLGPTSLAWTVGCVSLAVFLAGTTSSFWVFLPVFALGALGSGAFHPQGVMHSSGAAAGRAATTTAIFFLCGQVGLAGGPALTGALLDRVGTRAVYALAVLTLPTLLLMIAGLRGTAGAQPHHHAPQRERAAGGRSDVAVVAILVAIFTCRGWIMIGTASFLPVIFAGAGWSATGYGAATGLFWLGAGLSGVAGGRLADAYGRRPVVALTTLLGSVLLVPLPIAGGVWTFAVALATGALLGAAHSVLIVMVQSLLPVRRGLASGLALGYLFGSGAIASIVIGALGDRFGLASVIQGGCVVGVLAALLTLLLPASGNRARALESRPAPETAPGVPG